MAHCLFLYSTVDGHTVEIFERLRSIVEDAGHEVALRELTPETDIDLACFDVTVIGASIRYGKHRPEVKQFIDQRVEMLQSRPSAFFSVNAVARKPEKSDPDTNPYVKKFLKSISWQPKTIAIFGGKIDYPSYRFWDKSIIRFIMWMTKGPTDVNSTFDFTNWAEVAAFGDKISSMTRDS